MLSRISLLFLLSVLAFTSISLVRADEVIVADGLFQQWDLRGADGHNGVDGKNAYAPDCSGINILAGRDGEDGSDGEEGRHGADAFILFDNYKDLKKITINQAGGVGGSPGRGGEGSHGCNGGEPGLVGHSGSPGGDGDFGRIHLIDSSTPFVKDDLSTVLVLGEFKNKPIIFHKNYWHKIDGAKDLFAQDSNIKDQYYTLDHHSEVKVVLKWESELPIYDFYETKLGIALQGDKVVLNSISGAIFNYVICYESDQVVIEIRTVIYEYHFKNLRLGKMRSSGESLNLEVKEKYTPTINIETSFIVTLFEMDEVNQKEKIIGYYSIPESLVKKRGKSFFIEIGRLNFPYKYKKLGAKLKVHVSVYRKSGGQNRIISLRGLFKI